MTEHTDTLLDPEAAARIERIQRRRAVRSTAPKPKQTKRRRVATGTRIAALGLGGTTMFGLVAAMAMADNDSGATPAAPPAQPQQPIVVVIHTGGGSTNSGPSSQLVSASAPAAPRDDVSTAQLAPVELRAQPVVRTVEVQAPVPAVAPAAAPAARTNGSR